MAARPNESDLKEKRASLKRGESIDRSAPQIDDAAHPGSAGTLRAISAGAYDLKNNHVVSDRSAPMIDDPDFVFVLKPNPMTNVLQDISTSKDISNHLKPSTRTNDRSAPQMPCYPTHVTTRTPPPRAVVNELKDSSERIKSSSELTRLQSVASAEEHGLVRTKLVEELKEWRPFIAEIAEHKRQEGVPEIKKHVHPKLVEELKGKRPSIEHFVSQCARQVAPETYRSVVNPSLVKEIKLKRPSIEAHARLHRSNSTEQTAGGE